jgi:tRNA dimethylallyltransferase
MKVVAVVGPTASGKSALGLSLAQAFGGEIISCDSTAVYRGLNIGTDKVGPGDRRGVAHHLIDVAAPDEVYSAARYATEAADAIEAIARRGHLPLVVGGTGFYLRALVRGIFPGPGRDDRLRARLERVADRRGVEALHRWLARVDPASGRRIQPRDRKRLVRALEVYLATGRPLTDHFADTVSPVAGAEVLTIGVRIPRPLLRERVTRRVDEQFARGVVAEVEALVAGGVPLAAHAFGGLVYRQVVDLIRGVRDRAATRDLVIQENMRYAKRQVTWFRKEPGIQWIEAPGESPEALRRATALVGRFLNRGDASVTAAVPTAVDTAGLR